MLADLQQDVHTESRLFLEEKKKSPQQLETVILVKAPERHIFGQMSSFVRLIPPLHPSTSDPFFQCQLLLLGIF